MSVLQVEIKVPVVLVYFEFFERAANRNPPHQSLFCFCFFYWSSVPRADRISYTLVSNSQFEKKKKTVFRRNWKGNEFLAGRRKGRDDHGQKGKIWAHIVCKVGKGERERGMYLRGRESLREEGGKRATHMTASDTVWVQIKSDTAVPLVLFVGSYKIRTF
jgi:hypothetical protein